MILVIGTYQIDVRRRETPRYSRPDPRPEACSERAQPRDTEMKRQRLLLQFEESRRSFR